MNQVFNLGNLVLQSGNVLHDAHIAYRTIGDPSRDAIILPTFYTGRIEDCANLIKDYNESLNASKFFFIIPALFGNGESTSPSNRPDAQDDFPAITMLDNVRAQYRLLTEKLGVSHVKAVIGYSMGGAQAYQWAVEYSDFMDTIVPICASARTSIHNKVFLEGVKSALIAARGGTSLGPGLGQRYPSNSPWTATQKEAGLKAFARVYAGWGFSQTFYRRNLFMQHYKSKDLEDFMTGFWENWGLSNDPDNLLVMLQTWQLADISQQARFGGDLKGALGSIKARVLVMPGRTDLYFPPEDSAIEVESMSPGMAKLAVIESEWGHWAGGGVGDPEDWQFVDKAIAMFLSDVQ